MPTQKETMQAIRELGLSCTINDGEFRVAYRIPHNEASAYYTDDAEDAIGTAKAMVEWSKQRDRTDKPANLDLSKLLAQG